MNDFPWHDPAFCWFAFLIACVIALVLWKILDEWPKLREEARQEKHRRKYRSMRKDDDDPPPPIFPAF